MVVVSVVVVVPASVVVPMASLVLVVLVVVGVVVAAAVVVVIVVVLVVGAVVSGIVIDGFGEKRDQQEKLREQEESTDFVSVRCSPPFGNHLREAPNVSVCAGPNARQV